MRFLLLLPLLFCFLPEAVLAQAATPTAEASETQMVPKYRIVPEKSMLRFTATYQAKPVEGKFSRFEGEVAFDPKHPDWSQIRIEVDLNSLSVANPEVQAALQQPEWLGIATQPKAVFLAPKLDRIPDTKDYYATGELDLHGFKKPVNINFTIVYQDEQKVVANGYATIDRSVFQIGQGEYAKDDVLKKTVRVDFRATAERK